MEVLVIRDRRKINPKQKGETVGKGVGIWSAIGEKEEAKISVSALVINFCFMSPSSLDNISKCNFVTTYRIRQQGEKYASCIQIHILKQSCKAQQKK